MLRPAFAACLGAAFGALTIGTARERFADILVQPADAYGVAFVSTAAFLLAVLVLACREPADRTSASRARPRLGGGHQPSCQPAFGADRPTPPICDSCIRPGQVLYVPAGVSLAERLAELHRGCRCAELRTTAADR